MKLEEFERKITGDKEGLGAEAAKIIDAIRAVATFYIKNRVQDEEGLAQELKEILNARLTEIGIIT